MNDKTLITLHFGTPRNRVNTSKKHFSPCYSIVVSYKQTSFTKKFALDESTQNVREKQLSYVLICRGSSFRIYFISTAADIAPWDSCSKFPYTTL